MLLVLLLLNIKIKKTKLFKENKTKNIKLSFQNNRESFVLYVLKLFLRFTHDFFVINGDIVLHNKAQTVQIWFIEPWRVNGISFLIWRDFFTRWILTEAMAWLSLTSALVRWSRTFKKAGILSDKPILSRSSDIKNPWSAIMLSFFAQSASFSKPLRRTISLS